MPNGRPTRRKSPRLARGFAVLIVTLVTGAGCQRFPLRYSEVVPESSSRPTTRIEPTTAEPGPPGELAPLPATPLAAATPLDESREPAPSAKSDVSQPPTKPPFVSKSSATPHIDKALARALAFQDVPVEPPTATAANEPVRAPDAPLELPALEVAAADGANDRQQPAEGEEPSGTEHAEPADRNNDHEVLAGEALVPAPADATLPPEPAPLEVPAVVADLSAPKPSSGSPPIDPEKPAEPVVPVDDWRDGLGRLHGLARQRAGEPGEAAQAWAIRSRVLEWLAGDGPEPAGETGRVWNSVLATLSTATGPETPDEPTLAYHLNAAVDSLESFAPLQITSLSFCRRIDGFGHYEPVEVPSVRPGQPVLVYCEMAGLRYEPDKNGFRSRLSSQVEVIATDGEKPVWSEALGTAEDLCRRRRRDYFVNYRIVVPKLSPGRYSLRLSQTDLVSNRSIAAAVAFTITP